MTRKITMVWSLTYSQRPGIWSQVGFRKHYYKASGGDGIPAELFKILKYDAVKVLHLVCQQIWTTQTVATRLENVSFSFQSQRKAMPKNVPTVIQLCLFHMLARLCSKSFKLGFSSMWTEKFQMYKLGFEAAEEPGIKLLTFIGSWRK